MKILIVEDEAAIAMQIELCIQEMGYTVIGPVSNGLHALQRVETERPDIALMDVRLVGGMDGTEVALQLRTRFDIPVVFLTAFADDATTRRCKESRPLGYLSKPFTEQGLMAAVEIAIQKIEVDHELERDRGRLAELVAERTAELERTNRYLKSELELRCLVEETLRDREQRLEDLLDNASDLIQSVGPDGCFTFVNNAWLRTLGYSEAEAATISMLDVIAPCSRDHCAAIFQRLKDGESVGLVEVTMLARDGREIALEGNVSARFEGGVLVSTRGIFRDVTERKAAATALREHEEDLRAVLEASPEAVGVINTRTGRFEKPNAQLEQLLGVVGSELVGMGPGQLVPEIQPNGRPSAQMFEEQLEEALRGGQPVFEWTVRNRCGDLVACEMRLAGLSAPRKHLVRFSLTDITRRKLAEEQIGRFNRDLEALIKERSQELAESEQRFRAMFDSSIDGIVVAGHERVVLANPAFARLLGRDPRRIPLDIVNAPIDSFVHPEERQRQVSLHRRRLAGEEFESTYEIRLLRQDEQMVLAEFHVSRFLVRDVAYTLVICRDITERRNAERLLLRGQRMESIGRLAGGIAHDLNNALNPVLLSIEHLLDARPAESEWLRLAEAGTTRSIAMVRQLLTFARGVDGQRVLLEVHRLIGEVERIVRSSFPRNLELLVRQGNALPPVLGDAGQLHQALLNVCLNARDAMPDGGTLTIESESVHVDPSLIASAQSERAKPGVYVVIRFRDTGSGIPNDLLDKIFEPFFTTKDPDRATGFGLSTALGIVKSHCGFFTVESVPGRGSCFAIYLPVAPREKTAPPGSASGMDLRGNGETILYVDDESLLRDVVSKALKSLNYNPITVSNGEDALDRIQEGGDTLSAIITDLHMPGMDGLALVRALRQEAPSLPVIVVTGNLEVFVAEQLKASGVSQTLEKPIRRATIAAALRTVLQASRPG
ncbi:MAG: PAS domain S-box protein [Verrucomicrobia bacterium]|nr:PAS domain S-box protein [Verrucomicrobiota bacterium]